MNGILIWKLFGSVSTICSAIEVGVTGSNSPDKIRVGISVTKVQQNLQELFLLSNEGMPAAAV